MKQTPKQPNYGKIIDSREDGSNKYSDDVLRGKIRHRIAWLSRHIGCEVWLENGCCFVDDETADLGFSRAHLTEDCNPDVNSVANQVVALVHIIDCM